jgi:hypothetical protein
VTPIPIVSGGGSSSSSSSNVDVIVNPAPLPAEPSTEAVSDDGFLHSSSLVLGLLIWLVALTIINLAYICMHVLRCGPCHASQDAPPPAAKSRMTWSTNQQRSVVDNTKNLMRETSYQEKSACVQFESIEDVLGTVVPVKRSNSTCSTRKDAGFLTDSKL